MLTAKPPYWPTPNLPMARRKYRRRVKQITPKITPKVDLHTDLLDDPHSLHLSPPPIYFSLETNQTVSSKRLSIDLTPYGNRI